MLVNPLPGANRENVRDVLRHLHSKVSNLRAGTPDGTARQWLAAYLEWANEAARMLRSQLIPSDVNRLVLTRRYELLWSMLGRFAPDTADRTVNDLLSTEIDE